MKRLDWYFTGLTILVWTIALFLIIIVSINGLIRWISSFIEYLLSDDTFAQWIMAVSSVLSVIISVIVFFYIKRTFDVSNESKALTLRDLKLSHHPRFKLTRCVVFAGHKVSILPKFQPGEEIFGYAYAINFGRYDAAITQSDVCFCWSDQIDVPMSYFYERLSNSNNLKPFVRSLEDNTIVDGSSLNAGEFCISQKLSIVVPDNFKISEEKRNDQSVIIPSHYLFIIGFIRYIGGEGEKRGNYFCKRYSYERKIFLTVDEHENED